MIILKKIYNYPTLMTNKKENYENIYIVITDTLCYTVAGVIEILCEANANMDIAGQLNSEAGRFKLE